MHSIKGGNMPFRPLAILIALLHSLNSFAYDEATGNTKTECAQELIKHSLKSPAMGESYPDLAERLSPQDITESTSKAEKYLWMTTNGSYFAKFVFSIIDQDGNSFQGRIRINYQHLRATNERTGKIESEAYICKLAGKLPFYEFTVASLLAPHYSTPYLLKNSAGTIIQKDQ